MQCGFGPHREQSLGLLSLGLLNLDEPQVAVPPSSLPQPLQLPLSSPLALPWRMVHALCLTRFLYLLRRIDDNINNVTCIQAALTTNQSTGDKSFAGPVIAL
jgi:hypothetical protein